MHSPLEGSKQISTRVDVLERVERRLGALVVALRVAGRPAEALAAANILLDLRGARAVRRLTRIA